MWPPPPRPLNKAVHTKSHVVTAGSDFVSISVLWKPTVTPAGLCCGVGISCRATRCWLAVCWQYSGYYTTRDAMFTGRQLSAVGEYMVPPYWWYIGCQTVRQLDTADGCFETSVVAVERASNPIPLRASVEPALGSQSILIHGLSTQWIYHRCQSDWTQCVSNVTRSAVCRSTGQKSEQIRKVLWPVIGVKANNLFGFDWFVVTS